MEGKKILDEFWSEKYLFGLFGKEEKRNGGKKMIKQNKLDLQILSF